MADGNAVKIKGFGGTEVLAIAPYVVGAPVGAQVKVRVHAAGLNRADVLQRKGFYPAPQGVVQDVPGLEYAGEIIATGPGVVRTKVGDRAMGIVAGGAMATEVLVDEAHVLPVPKGFDWVQAAAVPEAYMTAMDALINRGRLSAGERVLVHAAGSGVGIAVWQLAQVWGFEVWGSTRTRSKVEQLGAAGLAHVLCVENKVFKEQLLTTLKGAAVDVIIDLVGAAYLEDNLKVLADSGRVVHVGLLGGTKATLDLGRLLEKRITLVGTVLRTRTSEEKAVLARQFIELVFPLFEQGRMIPIIDSVMPMAQIKEAHEKLERNDTLGKIVLTW